MADKSVSARGGERNDGDAGLMHVGARYYDPSIGRFITSDPVQDGANWYAYCGNNPLGEVDPEGLDANDRLNRGLLILLDPKEWRNRWRDKNGNDTGDWCPNCGENHPRYTDCGRFVAAVVGPDDPNFPSVGTGEIIKHIKKKGWDYGSIGPTGPEPGDVLLRQGHVAIYVGDGYEQEGRGKHQRRVRYYYTWEGSFGDHGPEFRKRRSLGEFDMWAHPE
jgi:RHS repeat-associated protein